MILLHILIQIKLKFCTGLIKNTDKGWIAMGDNNPVEDKTKVTESNYIGILV